jgi:UDP-GlcNAc:undecaprenyl-phosphate GlcNAc-1-phosphate transferase
MNTYLTLFIIALVVALFLTPVIRRLSQRMGWVDVPRDERRLHKLPIPRLGGVAVYISVVLALMAQINCGIILATWQQSYYRRV